MTKKGFLTGMLGVALAFGLWFTGCESMGDILGAAGTVYGAGYSSTSEAGLVYTFDNRSSHDVTVWDDTGRVTIPAGGSLSARFNKDATIYNVSYTPADLVSASLSVTTFTFRDK
jgi:hypothetical protein